MDAQNRSRLPTALPDAAEAGGGLAPLSQELGAALTQVQQRLRGLLRGGGVGLGDEQRELLGRADADIARALEHLEQLGRPPTAAPAPGNAVAADDRGRFTVLYADDDAASRDLVGELLGQYFDVRLAVDGSEALRLARSLRPDIIVTDLDMPGVDGLALLSLMRTDEDTSHIPLLVVSASGQTESKVQCFEAGAIDYLTKPVVPGELVARVRNALTRSEDLRRERALQATDDLTGLANRRHLRAFLSAALRSAGRVYGELTLVAVDQDRLKQINDRHGHAAGDLAIKTLAQALASCKRSGDLAARIGGDEFVVCMPDTDRAGAGRFVARVKEELSLHPLLLEDGEVFLSASFGLASASERHWEESAEQLMKRADRQLYDAKREPLSRITD